MVSGLPHQQLQYQHYTIYSATATHTCEQSVILAQSIQGEAYSLKEGVYLYPHILLLPRERRKSSSSLPVSAAEASRLLGGEAAGGPRRGGGKVKWGWIWRIHNGDGQLHILTVISQLRQPPSSVCIACSSTARMELHEAGCFWSENPARSAHPPR